VPVDDRVPMVALKEAERLDQIRLDNGIRFLSAMEAKELIESCSKAGRAWKEMSASVLHKFGETRLDA